MNISKKTGIMGGTFDPIHNGHLLLAQSAYYQLKLDKVLFIPSGHSYMKKNVLDINKRIEMVQRAIEKFPYFELSLIEAHRPGNTYTYETLEILASLNPTTDYYFIIGADSLFQIETWRCPERIFQLATLVCAVREHYDMERIEQKGTILAQTGANIIYLNIPQIEISSTMIRKRVGENLPIYEYVPKQVAEYVEQEHLYCKKLMEVAYHEKS